MQIIYESIPYFEKNSYSKMFYICDLYVRRFIIRIYLKENYFIVVSGTFNLTLRYNFETWSLSKNTRRVIISVSFFFNINISKGKAILCFPFSWTAAFTEMTSFTEEVYERVSRQEMNPSSIWSLSRLQAGPLKWERYEHWQRPNMLFRNSNLFHPL